jgi:hypothetical protein
MRLLDVLSAQGMAQLHSAAERKDAPARALAQQALKALAPAQRVAELPGKAVGAVAFGLSGIGLALGAVLPTEGLQLAAASGYAVLTTLLVGSQQLLAARVRLAVTLALQALQRPIPVVS